ncbi:hypothetical protein GCM10010193_46750 [Kitasatospora atroaurantiaca]|uniref:Peptidase S24-like protein n=1 Tax=Kitasatospora atroaurantiaca TaxID=285545 RepID=A0A561EZB0_9ACTN|nr:S24/S26 family peptidase [Kitasatospora atroaurantiaca]TWE20944.1 peptidase S24-like protein [Kitasatospora atroaurantiaca]
MSERAPEAELLRAALAAAGRARVRAQGSSMLPAIRPGTVVTIVARPFEAVAPGDVVAFSLGRRVIVHRAVGRTGAGVLTLGDNLPLFDPPVSPDDYLGVVPEFGGALPPRRPDLAALRTEPGHGHGRVRLRTPASAPTRRAGELLIGISPYAALPVTALDEILAAAGSWDVGILLGFTFGCPPGLTATAATLPPEAADFHVRLGEPLRALGLADALRVVGSRMSAPAAVAGRCS